MLRKILRDAELSPDEFRSLLHGNGGSPAPED